MRHLDEGIIEALLDGEVSAPTATAIEAHVAECAACSARLAEARLLADEAARLLDGLEANTPSDAPPELAPPETRGAPVVLVPVAGEDRHPAHRARRWGWAATIVVAAGVGYYAWQRPAPPARGPLPALPPAEAPTAPAAALAAPAAPAATSDAAPLLGTGPQPAVTPRPTPPPEALSAPTPGAGRTDGSRADAPPPPSAPPPSGAMAARAAAPLAGQPSAARGDSLDVLQRQVRSADSATAVATRSRALENQVREADSAAAARAANAVVLPPAPPSRTDLAARAGLTQRIGLDEARQQLGVPLHVIDGLRPEVVGLVPGANVPGADSGRPVVRVVYLDQRNRVVYLDQQRLPAGAPRGAGSTPGRPAWLVGDVRLSLSGEAPPDSLRALESRVR